MTNSVIFSDVKDQLMTVRDEAWHHVLLTLSSSGEFRISELPFSEGQRHTVRRVLKEMSEKGWLYRENTNQKTWEAGELAREKLQLSEYAQAKITINEQEREE